MSKDISTLSNLFSHISAGTYFVGGAICTLIGIGMIAICTYFEATFQRFLPTDANAIRNFGHIWLIFGTLLAFLGPIVGIIEAIKDVRIVIKRVDDISQRLERIEAFIQRDVSSSPSSLDT